MDALDKLRGAMLGGLRTFAYILETATLIVCVVVLYIYTAILFCIAVAIYNLRDLRNKVSWDNGYTNSIWEPSKHERHHTNNSSVLSY